VSRELIDWAEVVVCEWCLGNAVWYTANKRAHQRLLVRFHRFEFETDYPAAIDAGAVDVWTFAGPHFLEMASDRFGWPAERCAFLPNGVDVGRYDRPKRDGARFTLGILGYHRRLKRLDLALDLLERLREHDPRFRLSAKGQDPREVNWVWEDDEERRYFEELFARLEDADALRDAVESEPYDDTVPEWFTRVGFVLSPSDVESFHLAAAEGMASGAVPLVRRREGVVDLFPERWIFDDMDEMLTMASAVRRGLRTPLLVALAGEGQ
jgi:glycosyltransferase involved in cell wall biosynthesis